ncbi:MAG: hypothetical protein OXU71_04245 [Gammaproteobacteria bacterium]|nr:hypothetical protein [Gammaproteobacteria bacterium]
MNKPSANPRVFAQLRDPAFRRKIRQLNPDALAACGFSPEQIDAAEFKVVDCTPQATYLAVAKIPAGQDMSADELRRVQAARGGCANLPSPVPCWG